MLTELVHLLWRPLVDISVLTIAFYYGLIFVRGTRGWPVVIGFLVVLALTFVAGLLRLDVLSTFLRSFFAFSAIAVLVLFQPEFGGLIAIEQSIGLQEVVESGIPVNCEATPEMLETIFFPNNAIHDGGVIIKGDKIAYAACIFPRTHRQDLNKSLGTRHRAALGLSEETDAVVVVVSEETRQISLAYKGQLTRNVTLEDLRAFLTLVFVKRSKRGLREWINQKVRRSAVTPANGAN